MFDYSDTNLWAVLVAALVSFLIGGLWVRAAVRQGLDEGLGPDRGGSGFVTSIRTNVTV